MNDGHAKRVQAHYAQNNPVEALGFHHAANEEARSFLLAAEV